MSFSPDGSFVSPNTLKKKTRDPHTKELQIYEFVRSSHPHPVSFHQIQSHVKLSSGAVQSAINRCLNKKDNEPFKIYEGSKISDITNRKIRIFSVEKLDNPKSTALISNQELEQLHSLATKIQNGDLIETEDLMILPLQLKKPIVSLLQNIISLTPNLNSMGELFSQAIIAYVNKSVSPEILEKAKRGIQ